MKDPYFRAVPCDCGDPTCESHMVKTKTDVKVACNVNQQVSEAIAAMLNYMGGADNEKEFNELVGKIRNESVLMELDNIYKKYRS